MDGGARSGLGYSSLPFRRTIMGEGNHLPANGAVGQSKGHWMWILGGAAVAVAATGLLMQYVRGTTTQAASETSAGTAKVASNKKSEPLARVGDESIAEKGLLLSLVKPVLRLAITTSPRLSTGLT